MENPDSLKLKIQILLGKDITQFSLKGKGACNNAYYVETGDGKKYIVKQERNVQEFVPQNSLVIEARVIQRLNNTALPIPIPRVVFISDQSKMYGYEYIAGDIMRDIWPSLSEEEKVDICRSLGEFHADIGKNFTRGMAEESGIKIDPSADVHPEVTDEYNKALVSTDVPDVFKKLIREAKRIFDGTADKSIFHFLHNDAHHENVIIRDKKISGMIDFGNAEYGETAKEFSRYIRDYPDYFQHIVSAYEARSGNKLSYARLVSNALICDVPEIAENYKNDLVKAENSVATYKRLMTTYL